MKIFLDTNVLLRYFLKENTEQFTVCEELISQIEEGNFQAYTSSIVFLEMSFILKGFYKIPFLEILKILDSVLTIKGITIIEQTNLDKALAYHKKYKIKFSDCLIASQIPESITLATFDAELYKITEISAKPPHVLLTA